MMPRLVPPRVTSHLEHSLNRNHTASLSHLNKLGENCRRPARGSSSSKLQQSHHNNVSMKAT